MTNTAERLLADIRELAHDITSRAAEIEAGRRIPPYLVEALRSIGVFRMLVPQSHGGLEFDLPTALEIIKALSRIDGSIGWIVTIGCGSGVFASLLPRETYEQVYQNGPDAIVAGSVQPAGTAEAVAGGWRVNGRWPFASGCQHADWMFGLCVMTEEGKSLPGTAGEGGPPLVRGFFLPAREWQIENTWYVAGLKGTGSHHIALKDTVVSSANFFDPASGIPCLPGPLYQAVRQLLPVMHSAICVGIAEGALDELVELANTGRQQLRAAVPMRDSETFQGDLGRIAAEIRAARAFLQVQATSHRSHALAGTLRDEALFTQGTQAAIWIATTCVRGADACFALGGSSALYETSPLQRRLRDLHVAAQHAAAQQRHLRKRGQTVMFADSSTTPTKRVTALSIVADWKCMYITSNRPDQNLRTISISNIRTLWLSSLGSALEFYDFIIFVFFTAVIGKLFFPSDLPDWLRQLQTYGIFAVGYLARPLGGIVMAHFGDKYGRKRMFTLSVLLMAIPTLLIGFLPVYKSIGIAAPLLLLLMRIMQGVAIGGEGPGAWIFVAEHARRGRTGLAIGLLTSGLNVGILLGSLMATGLNLKFSQDQILHSIWRLPFVVGGVFGFIALFLRRWLSETPVFEEMRLRATLSKELPLRTVLRDYRRAVFASMAITWVLTAAIVVIILMTPLLLQKASSLPIHDMQLASLAGTTTLSLAVVAIGTATDKFGLRRVAVPVLLLLILTTYGLYLGAERMPSALLPLYILAGMGAGAAVLAPILIIRTFPPSVRFSGFSLSYNISYALFGGITPPLVSWMAHLNRINPAHYVAFVAFVGMITIFLAPTALASE